MAETAPTVDYSKYLDAPLLQIPSRPLEGQSALVTGATQFKGIGLGIAERFAAEGMRVFVVGTEKSQHIAPFIVDRLKMYGVEAYSFVGDITKREDCKRIVAETSKIARNRIDVLVNNAGRNVNRAFPGVTPEIFDSVLDPKAKGAWFMTQEWFIIRNRLQIRGGRVINIGSPIGSIFGGFGQGPYAEANGAIFGLTQYLALDLASRGVNTNIIAPSATEGTNIAEGVDMEQVRIVTPTQRLVTIQDIAGAAVFLAGPDAANINGVILPVDGGIKSNYTALIPLYKAGFRQVPDEAIDLIEGGITQDEIEAAMAVRRQRLEKAGLL